MLATVDEFRDRLGREMDDEEKRRAEAIIDDVSALVTSYCKRTFTTVPSDVKAVVLAESMSAFNTVPGLRSENIGDVQVSYSYSTGSGSLSSSSRTALDGYRVKFGSIPIVGGHGDV